MAHEKERNEKNKAIEVAELVTVFSGRRYGFELQVFFQEREQKRGCSFARKTPDRSLPHAARAPRPAAG